MTQTRQSLLLAAALLALTACAKHETPAEAAAEAAAAPHTSSSAGLPAGDAAAGKLIATQGAGGASCTSCHGEEGNAPIVDTYPKLGGQYADYLAHALVAYRSGARSGGNAAIMASQAANLTDQQIADVAAYFASVPGKLHDLHDAN
jgi:cytochrome c553